MGINNVTDFARLSSDVNYIRSDFTSQLNLMNENLTKQLTLMNVNLKNELNLMNNNLKNDLIDSYEWQFEKWIDY